jgi:hypothetical protein
LLVESVDTVQSAEESVTAVYSVCTLS